MKIKYSLVFNRKKKLRSDGTALVQIKAYLKGKNKYFSTQIYLTSQQWDDRNQKIKRHPNQYPLNKKIAAQIEELEVFELKLSKRQNGVLNLDQLENYRTENEYKSFSQFFMVEMRNEQVSKGTKAAYFTTFQKIKHFRKSIFFEELNYDLIRRFDVFLKKSGLKINTVAKHHKNMKKFINLAVKMNLLEFKDNPYRQFEIKKELTERVFLNEHEVSKIARLDFPEHLSHMEPIRDMFLFSCYTGLRYSDVSRVSLEQLTKETKGFRLNMTAKKTGKEINLPLYQLFRDSASPTSKPEQIINKQIDFLELEFGENTAFNEIPIFGNYSEQHINRTLKEIAALAGIEKNISTHIARHSFGTAMATKVKPPVLQKLMQHGSLKETEIYIHMSGQIIENELEKVNWG